MTISKVVPASSFTSLPRVSKAIGGWPTLCKRQVPCLSRVLCERFSLARQAFFFSGERAGKDEYEFLRHGEIYRSDAGLLPPKAVRCRPLPAWAAMSFQPGIPWPVALQQSQPPLPRLETIFSRCRLRCKNFLSASGLAKRRPQVPERETSGSHHSRHCRETCQRWRAASCGPPP
jgi:hypothetical protein